MNIKDVLRYGLTGARERELATQGGESPTQDRQGIESWRGPVGAISRVGGNIGRRVLGFFDGLGDDRPPLLSRANRNPSYGIPDSLNQQDQNYGPQSDLGQPWGQLTSYVRGPGLSDAEIQQQREQFDRFRNDPNSVYYQGPRAGDPMPGQIQGPNAHNFRNPTRELYDASQARTGSGEGFNDAVAYYRSQQRPNRNIVQ